MDYSAKHLVGLTLSRQALTTKFKMTMGSSRPTYGLRLRFTCHAGPI